MSSVTDDRIEAILDTSVLILFLDIDRCDLFAAHPRYVFLVPDDVAAEITVDYPLQQQRLFAALAAGQVRATTVDALAELQIAAKLKSERLGRGECAALAAAIHRGHPIALQDKTAQKMGKKHAHHLNILTVESLIVDLIVGGTISVAIADGFKAHWAANRFNLPKFKSFAELLPKAPPAS